MAWNSNIQVVIQYKIDGAETHEHTSTKDANTEPRLLKPVQTAIHSLYA
jgi:hypothetical protein